MTDTPKIDQKRLDAALLSGGVSSVPIYGTALSVAVSAMPGATAILDYGSGSGQLLPLLSSAFPAAVIHAADIMERPTGLPDGIVWHRADLNAEAAIEANFFDLVCAIEVIEHLENPRHMLREIARSLKPGGAAVLSTPNTGSIKSLLTLFARQHHAQFDDDNYPAHITAVGEVDLLRAGNEAGLTLERFFYTDSGTIPKLLHKNWQSLPVVGSRLRGRRFSDNFGAVLRKPVVA